MNILTWLLLTLMVGSECYGQGTVNFQNRGVFIGGDHLVYSDYVGGTKLVGTNYVAELYYGPDGAPASSLVPLPNSLSHFRDTATTYPGTWVGVNNLALPIGGVFLPITLEVRVWDISQATSFDVASARSGDLGQFGESGPFIYIQNFGGSPSPTDTEMVNLPAFALVPEPSAFLLTIAGAMGLLLLRQRKPRREQKPCGELDL